jgi:hypothetical protein
MMAVQPEVYFSRWLPLPTWNSRNCGYFITNFQSSPTLVECSESFIERNCRVRNANLSLSKVAATTILNFEKLSPFLCQLINLHQIQWECSKSHLECEYIVSKAQIQYKFKMAAAVILNLKKNRNNSSPFD